MLRTKDSYSSLNTLKDLDFDLIKIDMGFIQNLDASPSSRVIFSSIVHMAKLLGLHTLVEGVETEEQLSFVRSTGCELVQGYLFSRPVEANKLERDILSSELPIEKSDEHEYYTKLGMLNPQSSTPLVFAGDEGTKIEASKLALMLAIVELEGGMLRTLHASEGFGQTMVEIGLPHILDGGLVPYESPRAAAIHSLINVARASGGIESLELMKENTRYQVRARYVASMRERDSFAVTISRSGSSLFSNASASESTLLSDMLYMYDQVDIFDLETGAAQNFFRCNAEYPYGYEGKDVAEMAARYVEENVHPQDRAGFVEFENVSTAERRLAEQHANLLTATFRIKSLADGTWRWKIFILVPVTFDGRRCLLSATRDANLRNVHKIANASSLSV